MKQEHQDFISEALGGPPIEINSKIFVPQNRVRLYWTNIPILTLPEYRKRSISDVLEVKVDERYFLTDSQLSKLDLNFNWSEREIIGHRGGVHHQDRVYRYDGIMACLSASSNQAARHLTKTYLPSGRIRRLTEVECERLQGVPDNFTQYTSSSNRYELLGDGWTVDVISHILKGLIL